MRWGRRRRSGEQHHGRTAWLVLTGAKLMNRLHHRNDMIYRSIGKDAVTQVKDVSRPPVGASENLPDPAADLIWGGKKRDGIQVSLDADVEPNSLPPPVQISPPIHADNVPA